jgi:uncharacterized protein (TIGR03032 family)
VKTDDQADGRTAMRSVHTVSFAQILADRKISLLVSTYQAGKLVVLRSDGAEGVNTHFCGFEKPMGVAAEGGRLAVGTAVDIREYHNVPAAAAQLEPRGRHDAAYAHRMTHVTGNIQVHEMAWIGQELWFVNTRFSCLCTRGEAHNFIPRWRPMFVSALAPEDRCHLNGLAVSDGIARYVTALGKTDSAAGWRANKAHGGVVIDITVNQIVASGLSMPHSPRVRDGKLWVMESGKGEIGVLDVPSGRMQTVARLPGFTRGLSFHGPLAFIGLSQVRETAQFSGIPIAEVPLEDRFCGVWVIDTRSGQIVAFLKFQDAVQEIFAVEVVEHRYPDLIAEGPALNDTFVLPEEALADVPATVRDLRGPGNATGA